MKPTVLYLSPHRDDIAYSLAGRILAGTDPAESGIAMTVFTKSTFAPYAEPGLGMDEITALRRMEEERFCRALNLECAGLSFAEAPLRGYKTVDDLFVSHSQAWNDPIIPSLLSEFRALVGRIRPERVYAPLGIAGHVDHLATRFAAQMAFEDACPLLFYEDLPYVGELAGEALQSELELATRGLHPEMTPVGGWFPEKVRLLNGYASQVAEKDVQSVISYTNSIGGERAWSSR